MSGLHRALVAVLDSPAYRRLARSGPGRRVLRSSPYRAVLRARRAGLVALSRLRHPDLFDGVETCVVFVGHTKSGGTLLGSLLDAHPDVVCSDEVGLAMMLAGGTDRDTAFRLVARNAEREAMKGRVTARRLEPYSFAVPGGRQGVAPSPRVVGDTRAGPTTRALADDAGAVARLEAALDGIVVRYVHVVRNPFDPIAAMVVRGGRTVEEATADYERQSERLDALAAVIDGDRLSRVRYEAFVDDPVAGLSALCAFVGVTPTSAYLEACAGIVEPAPRRDRDRIEWSPDQIAAVDRVAERHPFLAGYRYEVA